jgi:HEAT repeat protein
VILKRGDDGQLARGGRQIFGRLVVGLLLLAGLAAGCGQQRAETYITLLSDADRQVRLDAGVSLISLGGAAVEPLIEHASAGTDSLRYIAAQILGQIGDPRAATFLQELLHTPNRYVREQAVRALGQLGDPGMGPALEGVLASDTVPEVRTAAAWSLGNLRDTTAVAALVLARQDSAAPVRQGALSALQFLWTPAAEAAVIAALLDRDETVRFVAAQLLGYHRAGDAVDELCQGLADSSLWVRLESARALGLIGDTRAVAPLERLFAARQGPDHDAAKQVLGQLTGLEYAIEP